MNEFRITKYSNEYISINKKEKWPLVYLLRDEKRLYIGETINIKQRLESHSNNNEKKELKNKWIIDHEKATKSLIYFLESNLINHAFADSKLELVNKKMQTNELYDGHDFFGKEQVKKDAPLIWNSLKEQCFFEKDYQALENDELFKYSPFKEFSLEQREIIDKVNENIINKENSYIEGGAGTGKTLLIIRIAMNHILKDSKIKIGIYSAKKGNTKIFKRVIKNLDKKFRDDIKVIENFRDISTGKVKVEHLLIDEAQRLNKKTKNSFADAAYMKEVDYKDDVSWLERKISNQTYFYDRYQTIGKKDFSIENFVPQTTKNHYILSVQYRMDAGQEYLSFIKEFLQLSEETTRLFNFNEYYFKNFYKVEDMIDELKDFNDKVSKSRIFASLVTSFAKGSWRTEKIYKSSKVPLDLENHYDFKFNNGKKFIWNRQSNYNDWLEKSTFDEIGCVHTAQGKDFNYAGIIFGEEIDYDPITKKIIFDFKKYPKKSLEYLTIKEKEEKIKNTYYILLTRGIMGTTIYIPNKQLRIRFETMLKERIIFKKKLIT